MEQVEEVDIATRRPQRSKFANLPPIAPRFHRISVCAPDFSTPHCIRDMQFAGVAHYPLGDGLSG